MPSVPAPQSVLQSDLEALGKYHATTFDRAHSYSQVIVGLGFGGLLTVWSASKQVLSRWEMVSSGLLIVISIVVFALYTVLEMIWYARSAWRFADESQRMGLHNAVLENDKRLVAIGTLVKKTWFIAFVIDALTGFGAAGILIVAFCCRLLRLDIP